MLWSGWRALLLVALLGGCSSDSSPSRSSCDGPSCSAARSDAAAGSHLKSDAGQTSARDDAGDRRTDGDADTGTLQPPDSDPGTVIVEPADDATYIFDQTALRDYNIVVAPADLAKIDQDPAAEEYVQGTLEFEGQTYGPLGVRYKGSVGAFLAPCTNATSVGQTPGAKVGKCSMKLDFNHVDDDARFYGLKQINFHAMGQDPSQLRDRLGYAMFREMNVAAPRAVHARVSVNGQLQGLFVVVEQIDGRFTRSRFTEGGKGNLYKEVWPAYDTAMPYQAALQTNEDVAMVDKMLAFKRAIDQGGAAIESFVDRDYLLRYLAVDRVIINDDGALHWYCSASGATDAANHNYYWYEAEQAQRLWLVPWDLDSSFGQSAYVHISPAWTAQATCSCAGSPPQRPSSCDPLIADWASWNTDFGTAVANFVSGPFTDQNVSAKLDAWTQQIDAATLAASGVNGAPIYFVWQASVTSLRSTISSARTNHGYSY